jgi:hypothetical protein
MPVGGFAVRVGFAPIIAVGVGVASSLCAVVAVGGTEVAVGLDWATIAGGVDVAAGGSKVWVAACVMRVAVAGTDVAVGLAVPQLITRISDSNKSPSLPITAEQL